jgi:voltage-gated potassium channel
MIRSKRSRAAWRQHLYIVIFGTDTAAGRAFDLAVLSSIVLSVVAVMLESVDSVRARYGASLRAAEWLFTILFTSEYILRVVSAVRPGRYVGSFFGIIDLLAVLPSYFSLVVAGTQSLIVIRALRLLRAFRILKMYEYSEQSLLLMRALKASRPKITVFLGAVMAVVIIVGSMMYVIEGEDSGFTSIPISMYWAVVTMTTVGYGDIAPQSTPGRVLASILMILGYGIIAVPTGIVTVELARAGEAQKSHRPCPACNFQPHDEDARHCKRCGAALQPAG